jgi:hypothetical protein
VESGDQGVDVRRGDDGTEALRWPCPRRAYVLTWIGPSGRWDRSYPCSAIGGIK